MENQTSPAVQPAYQERYCAFIDILGFRQLIDELTEGKIDHARLRDLLEIVHDTPRSIAGPQMKEAWGTDFRTQSISDAVAISTLANVMGLADILFAIDHLALNLLFEGYFIRGSLVKGMLYHDQKMVFGEALVRAYNLESEVVRYPRVMALREIDLDIARYSADSGWARVFKGRLLQANDGPMYVNVLKRLAEGVAGTKFVKGSVDKDVARAAKIRDQLQKRFDGSIDNPKHFEKAQWFASYWNRSFAGGLGGLKPIAGAGLEGYAD